MSGVSQIEWTDRVWNPTVGCTRVSPGCKHCYAFALHDRRHEAFKAGKRLPLQYARPFKDVMRLPLRLPEPLSWRKPARVFVNSMSDLFHEDIPDEFIAAVFGVMAAADRHTFQVLTKRPERMRRWFDWAAVQCEGQVSACIHQASVAGVLGDRGEGWWGEHGSRRTPWPLPNVWLGVSVEDQAAAGRLDHLMATPAALRFGSFEPLLGPLQVGDWLPNPHSNGTLAGYWHEMDPATPRLRWAIVGGESGPGARPMQVEWARSIVGQCRCAGVACFVKQLGHQPVYEGAWRSGHPGQPSTRELTPLDIRDPKGGDMAEWPADLRVRDFPTRKESA